MYEMFCNSKTNTQKNKTPLHTKGVTRGLGEDQWLSRTGENIPMATSPLSPLIGPGAAPKREGSDLRTQHLLRGPEQGAGKGTDGAGRSRWTLGKFTAKCLVVHSYWAPLYAGVDGAGRRRQWGEPLPEEAERIAVPARKLAFLKPFLLQDRRPRASGSTPHNCLLSTKGKKTDLFFSEAFERIALLHL